MWGAWHRLVVALAILSISANAGAADGPDRSTERVRPGSRHAKWLIAEGRARSATVRQLMAELDRTDVIVYVQFTASATVRSACTALVAATPRARFLRILINARMPSSDRVELLGHELQHALEIASAPRVVDDDSMRSLYEEIGVAGWNRNQFETRRALEIQAAVRAEYAGRAVREHTTLSR